MATKVTLRKNRVSDAKAYFEMLGNPKFKYYRRTAKNIKEEIAWIKSCRHRAKTNFSHHFVIIWKGQFAGGCGIKIDQHRKYIGELGYFVDEKFWGNEIAPAAVKELEKLAFKKLKISRLQILMNPKNKASERVAIKCGYKLEGRMRKVHKDNNGKFSDCLLYAKVK